MKILHRILKLYLFLINKCRFSAMKYKIIFKPTTIQKYLNKNYLNIIMFSRLAKTQRCFIYKKILIKILLHPSLAFSKSKLS